MESAEAAGILHKGNKDETLLAFIDGKEVPIVQEADMYQASKGTWTPVGVTFVNKGMNIAQLQEQFTMTNDRAKEDTSQRKKWRSGW